MPELPEVQTVVTTLAPRLTSQTLADVRHLRPDIVRPRGFDLPAALVGRTVSSVTRRGKRIVIALDDGGRFYIHLGMTGQLKVEPPDREVAPHTHLIVRLRGVGDGGASSELRFRDPRRFGGVFWLGRGNEATAVAADDARMGPEPLTLRPGQLAKRLSRTTRAIKNALLDQAVVAGLGNIYVDEALFASSIHPLRPADELSPDDVKRLNRAIKTTLLRAIRHRGSTLRDYVDADGRSGGFQLLHRVYGREGDPCHTCRSPIARIVLGGRSAHFCPVCQPISSGKPGRRRTRVSSRLRA
jgi:formamidopyrimidine-DNA glycosylase